MSTGEIIRVKPFIRAPYRLEIEIQGLPKSLTNGSHSHWRVKHNLKKKWKELVWLAVARKVPSAPLEKAKLSFTRFSSKEMDFDNLVASFKPVCDALTECGVIVDDKSSVIGQPSYAWEKAPMKLGKIRVVVEEI